MTFKGNIPEVVKIIIGKTRKIHFSWNHIDKKYNKDFALNGGPFEGKGCGVVLPDGKYANDENVTVFENKPMSGIRLVGRSYHGNVPDQFLVLLPNGLLVEMETDSFMEVMLNEGIKPGGILPGEWIWARVPGTMKLVRLGTGFHQALLDYENRESVPLYSVKEMNVGRAYKNAEGNVAIFLGFINTLTMHLRVHPEDKEKTKRSRRYRYNSDEQQVRYDVSFNKAELATLWCQSWYTSDLEKYRNEITKFISDKKPYYIKAIKKHNYIEELDVAKFAVPDDIIMQTRNNAEHSMIEQLKRVAHNESRKLLGYSMHKQTDINLHSYTPTYEAAKSVRQYATMVNMVPFGVEPILSDTLSIFKPFEKKKNSEISKAINESKRTGDK